MKIFGRLESEMTMTERLKKAGYKWYKLFDGEFHTGYMIYGGKKMYLGLSWEFWSPSKYNLIFDNKKEVPRHALYCVMNRMSRTNNQYKKG